jgi:hypothetical protein
VEQPGRPAITPRTETQNPPEDHSHRTCHFSGGSRLSRRGDRLLGPCRRRWRWRNSSLRLGSQGQCRGRCRTMRWAEWVSRPGVVINWARMVAVRCARCQRTSQGKHIAPPQMPPEFLHTELLRIALLPNAWAKYPAPIAAFISSLTIFCHRARNSFHSRDPLGRLPSLPFPRMETHCRATIPGPGSVRWGRTLI